MGGFPIFDDAASHERLAELVGGVVVIRVGGAAEVKVKERKDCVDDAMHATLRTLDEGIVPGGGVAILCASERLKSVRWLPHLAQSGQALAYRSAFGPTSGAPSRAGAIEAEKEDALCAALRQVKVRGRHALDAFTPQAAAPAVMRKRQSRVADLSPAAAFSWGSEDQGADKKDALAW